MCRLAIFIIAVMLLAGAVEPTKGWLIALVVLSGLHLFNIRPWRMFDGPSRHWHFRYGRPRRWIEEPDW